MDFSRALISMTSKLGATEMNSLIRPSRGVAAGQEEASVPRAWWVKGRQGK